jgi:nitroreductase
MNQSVFDGLNRPLAEVMETQRSIRRLADDPVDQSIVRRCIELGLRAPTGSNGQNWEFVVVRDPDIKSRLARQYRRGWPLYRRTLDLSTPSNTRMVAAVQHQVDNFESIPVIVVACLRGGRPVGPYVAKSSYYGSIYPTVQNILLAARALELGASLITLPLWSARTSRRILGLPRSVKPACLIALGWPIGRYGPTTRRPVDEVIHLDRW